MTRVFLTRHWPETVERELAVRYEVVKSDIDRTLTSQELAEALREFDIVCPTVTDRVDETCLSTARVRLLANFGAGVDHIDLQAAHRQGVVVTNTPDVLSDATADIALTLMLMASRRVGEAVDELRSGGWSGWSPKHMMGLDLQGKNLGLIGYGRIARRFAAKAAACFGMNVQYFSRRDMNVSTAEFVASLDELVSQADIVSLHCPGGADTHHIINREILSQMKPSAIIINTARGSVMDYEALCDALQAKRIFAAGLDVYPHEPNIPANLLTLPNAILLPHLGSATLKTREAMGRRAAEAIDGFLKGAQLHDRVV